MTNGTPTVIFCSATNRIVDIVNTRVGEAPEAAVARLRAEYGTALTPMPYPQAHDLYEASFKTPVQEINAETFEYALNCLPPVSWIHARGAQSFKMSERMASSVTAIYVSMRGRFFRFYDHIRTPHDDCCQRVADFIGAQGRMQEEEGRTPEA